MAGRKRNFPSNYVVPDITDAEEEEEVEITEPNEVRELHSGHQQDIPMYSRERRGQIGIDRDEAHGNHGASDEENEDDDDDNLEEIYNPVALHDVNVDLGDDDAWVPEFRRGKNICLQYNAIVVFTFFFQNHPQPIDK